MKNFEDPRTISEIMSLIGILSRDIPKHIDHIDLSVDHVQNWSILIMKLKELDIIKIEDGQFVVDVSNIPSGIKRFMEVLERNINEIMSEILNALYLRSQWFSSYRFEELTDIEAADQGSDIMTPEMWKLLSEMRNQPVIPLINPVKLQSDINLVLGETHLATVVSMSGQMFIDRINEIIKNEKLNPAGEAWKTRMVNQTNQSSFFELDPKPGAKFEEVIERETQDGNPQAYTMASAAASQIYLIGQYLIKESDPEESRHSMKFHPQLVQMFRQKKYRNGSYKLEIGELNIQFDPKSKRFEGEGYVAIEVKGEYYLFEIVELLNRINEIDHELKESSQGSHELQGSIIKSIYNRILEFEKHPAFDARNSPGTVYNAYTRMPVDKGKLQFQIEEANRTNPAMQVLFSVHAIETPRVTEGEKVQTHNPYLDGTLNLPMQTSIAVFPDGRFNIGHTHFGNDGAIAGLNADNLLIQMTRQSAIDYRSAQDFELPYAPMALNTSDNQIQLHNEVINSALEEESKYRRTFVEGNFQKNLNQIRIHLTDRIDRIESISQKYNFRFNFLSKFKIQTSALATLLIYAGLSGLNLNEYQNAYALTSQDYQPGGRVGFVPLNIPIAESLFAMLNKISKGESIDDDDFVFNILLVLEYISIQYYLSKVPVSPDVLMALESLKKASYIGGKSGKLLQHAFEMSLKFQTNISKPRVIISTINRSSGNTNDTSFFSSTPGQAVTEEALSIGFKEMAGDGSLNMAIQTTVGAKVQNPLDANYILNTINERMSLFFDKIMSLDNSKIP